MDLRSSFIASLEATYLIRFSQMLEIYNSLLLQRPLAILTAATMQKNMMDNKRRGSMNISHDV